MSFDPRTRKFVDLEADGRCLGCGCTEERACPGGCSRFPGVPELCDRCVERANPIDIAMVCWGPQGVTQVVALMINERGSA